jgi:hypothetical protein
MKKLLILLLLAVAALVVFAATRKKKQGSGSQGSGSQESGSQGSLAEETFKWLESGPFDYDPNWYFDPETEARRAVPATKQNTVGILR